MSDVMVTAYGACVASYSNQFSVWSRDGRLLHQTEVPRPGSVARGSDAARDARPRFRTLTAAEVEVEKKVSGPVSVPIRGRVW